MALTKIESGGLSSGKILQVVVASFSTAVTTTSTSFVSLGSPAIEGTITPISTSSKILIRFITSTYTNSTAHSSYMTLYRGTVASGTHLGESTNGLVRAFSSAGQTVHNMAFEVIDEPSTTSAQTYQVGFKASSSSTAKYFVFNDTPAELILMEIAG